MIPKNTNHVMNKYFFTSGGSFFIFFLGGTCCKNKYVFILIYLFFMVFQWEGEDFIYFFVSELFFHQKDRVICKLSFIFKVIELLSLGS
jgi:hypothetical protein